MFFFLEFLLPLCYELVLWFSFPSSNKLGFCTADENIGSLVMRSALSFIGKVDVRYGIYCQPCLFVLI